jgi:uncharacterized membrane protein YkvI
LREIDLKNICKVLFVILGTIIGAGFASGREIFTFFNVYGYKGFIGLIVSMSFIGLIIYKTNNIILKHNISSYSEFMSRIIGNKKRINSVINNIVNIFLFISFQIMVAGFGAYFLQGLNINQMYGIVIIVVLSYITFLNNIEGLVKINEYLVPVMIIVILFLGFKSSGSFVNTRFLSSSSIFGWITSAILYASYNTITLIQILISLKKYIYNRKEAKAVSILVSIFLIIFGAIIYILLNETFHASSKAEMPVMLAASNMGSIYEYIYGFVIMASIFTTAISSGYSFLQNISKTKMQYYIITFVMCVSAIFISQIGFSNLVSLMYPVFGYLGIIQIFFILIA